MQFFTDPLRFQRILTPVKRFQYAQGCPHKVGIGKDTADPRHTFIGQNGNQGVDTILLFQFTAPPSPAVSRLSAQRTRFHESSILYPDHFIRTYL